MILFDINRFLRKINVQILHSILLLNCIGFGDNSVQDHCILVLLISHKMLSYNERSDWPTKTRH